MKRSDKIDLGLNEMRRTGSKRPNRRPNDDVTELGHHLEVILENFVLPSQSNFLPDPNQQLSFFLPLFSASRRDRLGHTRIIILEIHTLSFTLVIPIRGSSPHTSQVPHDIRKADLEERSNDLVSDRIGVHLALQPGSVEAGRDTPHVLLPDARRSSILRGFSGLVQCRLSAKLRLDESHDLLPEWDVDKGRERQAEVGYDG